MYPEHLVLYDTARDIAPGPTNLTISRDVLKTRRRISVQPRGGALSQGGLRCLRGQAWPAPLLGADSAVAIEAGELDGGANEKGEGGGRR